jgi:DNA-binding NarL/FixJ family response regulator
VIARFDGLLRPYQATYARYRLAAALLRQGGARNEAAASAVTAHRAARALGATPLATAIELLAHHARIDLQERGVSQPEPATNTAFDPRRELGLTERESEVLRLVAAGWSNQQIADALFITRKTASVHVSNILGKFGVRNRVEAAAIAQRLGVGLEDAQLVSKPKG